MTEGENGFRLNGYSKPIHCEESLCSEFAVDVREWLPRYAEFELVEIDGVREIAVVAGGDG